MFLKNWGLSFFCIEDLQTLSKSLKKNLMKNLKNQYYKWMDVSTGREMNRYTHRPASTGRWIALITYASHID